MNMSFFIIVRQNVYRSCFQVCGPKKQPNYDMTSHSWSLDSGVDDGPKICDKKNPSLPAHCILEPGNTWNTSSEIKRFSEKKRIQLWLLQ